MIYGKIKICGSPLTTHDVFVFKFTVHDIFTYGSWNTSMHLYKNIS